MLSFASFPLSDDLVMGATREQLALDVHVWHTDRFEEDVLWPIP